MSESRAKALDLLARRAHFRSELAAKLTARGFDEDDVEATLDRLEGDDLLDDVRTARTFVEERLHRGPVGARRLAADLRRRGAPDEAVTAALADLPADDREAALAAAARSGRRDPASLARSLERRGFSARAIVHVLRRSGSDADGAPGLDQDVDPDVEADLD